MFYVGDERIIGTYGTKGEDSTYEELFLFFMTSNETLVSYNEGVSELLIDSGKLATVNLGDAIQEYRDVNKDVTSIVTTPDEVTNYLHGVELFEY